MRGSWLFDPVGRHARPLYLSDTHAPADFFGRLLATRSQSPPYVFPSHPHTGLYMAVQT